MTSSKTLFLVDLHSYLL